MCCPGSRSSRHRRSPTSSGCTSPACRTHPCSSNSSHSPRAQHRAPRHTPSTSCSLSLPFRFSRPPGRDKRTWSCCIHTFPHRVRVPATEAKATHCCATESEWQAPRLRRLRRSTVWGFRMHRMFGSAVLAFALVLGPGALAHDRDDGRGGPALFVKIDGIDGESIQKGHEGEIEAFNFSETFRQSVTTGGGGGGGAGKFPRAPSSSASSRARRASGCSAPARRASTSPP
jgi:hypothetical protein